VATPKRTVLSDTDLTPAARIRNAALDLFAERGVARTTIREVAAHAGVSPGLVQHHFGTKARLADAVNEFVLAVAADTARDLPDSGDTSERFAEFGNRMAAIARDQPSALLYAARSVSDADEAGLALFAGMVEIGRQQLLQLEAAGQIEPGVDLDWVAVHLTVFNLGSLLFEPAISRALGEPFLTDAGIERWNAATTALMTRALIRRPSG
jgi:AcrR family transcriptional regulator